MAYKEFKTIDEQIEILKSRGLKFTDENQARDFLYFNNYYRISGYSLTLRNNDIFNKNATFQNIIDIYEFDRELRFILMKYIEILEVEIKSVYAYEFSKVHGPQGYLNKNYFCDDEIYEKVMDKSSEQKKSRHNHEAYLKHFIDDLGQEIPLWAYVDLFTISDISFFYKITESYIKSVIAESFGLQHKKSSELLEHFLHRLTIIRNLCAHGSRLYNRLFEQKPKLSKAEKNLLIINEKGQIDNAHLYGFILIIRKLLKKSDFTMMKSDIYNLTKKYPFVNLKYYGFREDWHEVL